jgi:hypothetical protein
MAERQIKAVSQGPSNPEAERWRKVEKHLSAEIIYMENRSPMPAQMKTAIISLLEKRYSFAIVKRVYAEQLDKGRSLDEIAEIAHSELQKCTVNCRSESTIKRQFRASLCHQWCNGGTNCAENRGHSVQFCIKKVCKVKQND